MSELMRSECGVCGASIGVLKKEGTNFEAKSLAVKIASTHCKSESGREWDTSKSIKKRPKVDMNKFSELF